MRTFDLSPLIQERTLTFYDHIDLILKDDEFRSTVKDIFRSLEELDTKYTNLVWLYHNIDTLRTDHVFQEAVGLQLAQEGYTCSMEVVGGISKTMSDMWNKIVEFFRKMMLYIQEVLSINTNASAELCTQLAKELQDPSKEDKLKKEYTTHGESVDSIISAFDAIIKANKDIQNTVEKIKAMRSNDEHIQAQGQEESAKTANSNVDAAKDRMNKESGNGPDRSNTQDGKDPIEGNWFNPQKLTELAAKLKELGTSAGTIRSLQSTIKAIANNTKSDTQQSKEMAKTKLDTIKDISKMIDGNIRLVMKCSTMVGKKCQILLKIVKK